ncbi:hypothetical protein [Nocardiopsis oceani]
MSYEQNPQNPEDHGQYPQPWGYQYQQPQGQFHPQQQFHPQAPYPHQGYDQPSALPPGLYGEKPPRSVRVQRVLLWIFAVFTLLSALVRFYSVGGGPYGVGYALAHFATGTFLIVLAVQCKPGARWVRISMIVLYSLMMLMQFANFTGGNPFGIIGFFIVLFALILACRASARDYFRKVPVPPGYGPQPGYGPPQRY